MVWVLRRPPALRAFMAASGPKPSDSQPAGHKPAFWSFDEPNWLYSELKLSFLQVHYANKNFHQKNQSKTKKLKSKWWQCFSTLELRVIRAFRPKKRPFTPRWQVFTCRQHTKKTIAKDETGSSFPGAPLLLPRISNTRKKGPFGPLLARSGSLADIAFFNYILDSKQWMLNHQDDNFTVKNLYDISMIDTIV